MRRALDCVHLLSVMRVPLVNCMRFRHPNMLESAIRFVCAHEIIIKLIKIDDMTMVVVKTDSINIKIIV